jgi:hypothetical protein
MIRKGLAGLFLFAAVLTVGLVSAAAAKDARRLNVPYHASLNGTPAHQGDYQVTWETHSPDATVTFTSQRGPDVVAKAEGKVVARAKPYDTNAVVFNRNADRSYSIVELRFKGLKEVIVFGD